MKWFCKITLQTLVQSVNLCCPTWRTIKPSHPRRGTIKMTLDMSFCKSSEVIRINNNLTWKQTRRVCLPNVWAMIETAHKLGLQPSWKPRHFHNSSSPPTLVSPAGKLGVGSYTNLSIFVQGLLPLLTVPQLFIERQSLNFSEGENNPHAAIHPQSSMKNWNPEPATALAILLSGYLHRSSETLACQPYWNQAMETVVWEVGRLCPASVADFIFLRMARSPRTTASRTQCTSQKRRSKPAWPWLVARSTNSTEDSNWRKTWYWHEAYNNSNKQKLRTWPMITKIFSHLKWRC